MKAQKDSKTPRGNVPEAWDNFMGKQKKEEEANLSQQRDQLRSKIGELEGKPFEPRGHVALQLYSERVRS